MNHSKNDRTAHAFRVAACVAMLAAAAASSSGRIFGRPLQAETGPATRPAASAQTEVGATRRGADGSIIADSSAMPVAVFGFGGPVPVEVVVTDGRVSRTSPKLPNDESPTFFGMLEEAGFWRAWDGLSTEAAATARVDAVAGATFSSLAAIANVRAAVSAISAEGRDAAAAPPPVEDAAPQISANTAAALAVLVFAAVAPFFVRGRRWRVAQMALDVAVLGLWSGTFLSSARLLGWASNGIPRDLAGLLIALLMLAMAFLYPIFGRAGHYCAHVCPFGAAQELAAMLPFRKLKLGPATVRRLTAFRRVLWAALMISSWCGLWTGWTELEPFAAFAWRAAPPLAIALALVSLVASAFVPRAWCRFACPTGTLFKIAGAGTAAEDRSEKPLPPEK